MHRLCYEKATDGQGALIPAGEQVGVVVSQSIKPEGRSSMSAAKRSDFNGKSRAFRVACRAGTVAQMVDVQDIERLDERGTFKMPLHHFTECQRSVFKHVNTSDTLGVVIHRVDDDLPGEPFSRYPVIRRRGLKSQLISLNGLA